jgi:O-acetyl-ADP-ribose deacetylase (regulator of RNase III)
MHKFILADINQGMVDAWKHEFSQYPNFEFHCGDVFEKRATILVSPANSFGFMNGGIDGAYSKKIGWHLQADLQEKIRNEFDGELLIGQSTVIPTNFPQYPFLLAAPTMRVPMYLQGSANVFLAAKAIFVAVKKMDEGTTCLIPGLGTGTGLVTFAHCASRMRMAYEDFYLGQSLFPKNLNMANIKHFEEITP